MRLSIRTKMILITTSTIAVLLCVVAVLYSRYAIGELRRQTLRDMEALALVVADHVMDHMGDKHRGHDHEVDEIISFIAKNYDQIYSIIIFDDNTRIVASTVDPDVGTRTRDENHLQILKDGKTRIEFHQENGGKSFAQIITPIKPHGPHADHPSRAIIGGTEILYHLQPYDLAAEGLKKMSVLFLAGSLAVVLLIALLVARLMTRPLSDLMQGLEEVSGGNYNILLPADRTDEFGVVAAAFNRMVAEIKRSTGELKTVARQLQESNDEIQNFAYIISHDLRAPLVSIKGFSAELDLTVKDLDGTLQKHFPVITVPADRKKIESLLRSDMAEAVNFINSSATRMDGLISAILNLSRMGHRELRPEPLHTKQFVQTILNTLAHQLESRTVKVALGELPDIVADKMALEQIFGNLLDNAVKYLAPDRPGRIDISAERRDGEAVFHVRDNGLGIAQEDIPKVFEIFKRVGKQDVPGEGMGLAYVDPNQTPGRTHLV